MEKRARRHFDDTLTAVPAPWLAYRGRERKEGGIERRFRCRRRRRGGGPLQQMHLIHTFITWAGSEKKIRAHIQTAEDK